MVKKFNCSTCKKPITDRNLGIFVWGHYTSYGEPCDLKVVHKNYIGNRDLCDPDKHSYSYEITDFIRDFPRFIISNLTV